MLTSIMCMQKIVFAIATGLRLHCHTAINRARMFVIRGGGGMIGASTKLTPI